MAALKEKSDLWLRDAASTRSQLALGEYADGETLAALLQASPASPSDPSPTPPSHAVRLGYQSANSLSPLSPRSHPPTKAGGRARPAERAAMHSR